MLCLLVYLLAIVILIGLAFYGLGRLPLAAPWGTVAQVVACVIGVVLLCGLLGWGYHLPMRCS